MLSYLNDLGCCPAIPEFSVCRDKIRSCLTSPRVVWGIYSRSSCSNTLKVYMAPLYARYVPLKRTEETQSKASDGDEVGNAKAKSSLQANGHEVDGRKKRKRSDEEAAERRARKEQKKRRKDDATSSTVSEVASSSAKAPGSLQHEEATAAVTQAETSKENPEESKKRKRRTAEETSDQTEKDDASSRHNSVMSKFQKATQKSSTVQVERAEEESGGQYTPRELHGEPGHIREHHVSIY